MILSLASTLLRQPVVDCTSLGIEDAVSVEMDLRVSSNDLAPYSFSIRLRVAETISLWTEYVVCKKVLLAIKGWI